MGVGKQNDERSFPMKNRDSPAIRMTLINMEMTDKEESDVRD